MLKTGGPTPVLCVAVYCPPSWMLLFFLSFLSFYRQSLYDRILISGDFNHYVDLLSDVRAAEFLSTMDSFNFVQLVSGPTITVGIL